MSFIKNIYAQVPEPIGQQIVVDEVPNASANPDVKIMDSGEVIVVWEEKTAENAEEIVGKIYSERSPIGQKFIVNEYVFNSQSNPKVAACDLGFVVVWQSLNQDSDNWGVYARVFNKQGAPISGEIRINDYVQSSQRNPDVAVDNKGNFIVTWQSLGQDGSSWGVYAKAFNWNTQPLFDALQVNSYTENSQRNPAVSTDQNGKFVIVWQSLNQDQDNWGVFYQSFDLNGNAQYQEEKRANIYQLNSQSSVDVAQSEQGGFTITWQSLDQDGDNWGVYARKFSHEGNAITEEFQVNDNTRSHQTAPSVSMSKRGNIVLAWEDEDKIFGKSYLEQVQQASSFTCDEHSRDVFTPTISINNKGDVVVVWVSRTWEDESSKILIRKYHINYRPTDILLSNNTLPEGAAAFSIIGTWSTDDENDEEYEYQLVEGEGSEHNSFFVIEGGKLKAKETFNYEINDTYFIRVAASSGDEIIEKSFTIHITDINEKPTSLSLSEHKVDENTNKGEIIGILTTQDEDPNDQFFYSITAQSEAKIFDIHDNQLVVNALIDYESASQHDIIITSRDKAGNSISQNFTIHVRDINESPTDILSAHYQIPYDAEPEQIITKFSTLDPDLNDYHSYEIIKGGEYFILNNNQLILKKIPSEKEVEIIIKSTDQGGLFYTKTFNLINNYFVQQREQVKVYPIPSAGTVHIDLRVGDQFKAVRIYNSQGNEIWESSEAQNYTGKLSVNLTTLPQGVYTLEIISTYGRLLKKIIKT